MPLGFLRQWPTSIYLLRRTLISSNNPFTNHNFRYSPRQIVPCSHPLFSRIHFAFLLPSPRSFSTTSRTLDRPLIRRRRSVSHRNVPIDRNLLLEVVELIGTDTDDLESNLHQLDLRLSRAFVSEILRALNDRSVSALRFFNWVINSFPDSLVSSETYNQIIDNFGRLDDYETMYHVLADLSAKGHCLTEKAFSFLTVRGVVGVKDSVAKIIEVLHRVGGSCLGSGVFSLIKVLSGMKMFELAIQVIEETTRKTSYYNVLVAAKCRNGDFQGARDLFDEMRRCRCDPNTKSYNYLLGCLLKNRRVVEACDLLQTMEEVGYCPDSVTFEVVAVHACKANRMDSAMEVLEKMFLKGVKPSLAIHAALIKGYFLSGRIEDAHKYIVNISLKDECSVNMNYSLLASLYYTSGKVVEAGRVLHEMMEKGLKPNFPVFVRVIKELYKMTRGDLASQLKDMFSKFYVSREVG